MSEVSVCGFCTKRMAPSLPSNHSKDKHWQCEICGYRACGECITLHYQKAHLEQYKVYREFPELLESKKVVFLPFRIRQK